MAHRVVIIDDVADIRFLIGAYLKPRGFDVVAEAASPVDGLALAIEQEVDAVVMDLSIPGHDSIAAIRTLRETLPSVRILAVSATVPENDAARAALDAGADAFFDKAAGFDQLGQAVVELLR
ncbi:MAG: response regulator [Acidimicrobiia bacterium]|nr:response regulator [Acidimicrobiia bacterium]